MSNYTVYADRPLQYAVEYAQQILVGYHGDYLFFRGSLNDSYLIWHGDIDGADHAAITFSDCYVYRITALADGSYQLDPAWSQSGTVSNTGYRIVYGSEQYMCKLLDNGGELIEAATLFALCVFTFYIVFHHIFKSVSRS